MTSGVQVGSIYTTYGLDLNPLRRAAQEAKQITRQIEADAGALAARARPIKLIDGAGAAADARAMRQAAQEANRVLRSAEQLERSFRRQADAEIAAARATGNYAQALSLVDRELAASNADLVRHNQLLARRAQIERQSAPRPTAPAGGGGAGSSLLAGAAGGIVALAADSALGAAQNASAAAAAFRDQERSLRILAGSTARYNVLLAEARQNQIIFGGSISQNLEPLQQLIFISNRANVDLAKLNETTRLLAATNTQEGAQGAGFAIGEFLSGDTTSIRERFNLPLKALNDIKNSGAPAAEQLRMLNELILTQGDVAAVLEQKLKGPQAEANKLGATWERITLAGGNLINAMLTGGAAAANSSGGVDRLAAATEAYAAAIERGQTGQMANLAFIQALVNPTQQAAAATEQATQATEQAITAEQKRTIAIGEAISAGQEKQLADQQQAELQNILNEAVLRVASGQSTQAAEVARLSALYPGLAAQADPLIAQQLRLAAATDEVAEAIRRRRAAEGDARLAGQAGATRDDSGGLGFNSPGRRGTSDVDAVVAAIEEQKNAQKEATAELAAARQRQIEQEETTAQRVARLRRVEADAAARQGKESAAYVNAQTERKAAERDLAAEREKAGAKGVKAHATAARQIATSLNTIENRTEDHYRKLAQLQEDYQQDAQRSQEDFDLRRTRSQEDFERQRRRLLAEGKIKEAQLLTEEFQREQAREQEDFNRKRQREQEDFAERQQRETADFGEDTSRTREKAAIRGVRVPGATAAAQVAQDASLRAAGTPTGAVTGAPARLGAPIQVTLTTTPTAVQIDGQQVAILTWPHLEVLITEDLSATQLTSPAQTGAVTAVGGLRA